MSVLGITTGWTRTPSRRLTVVTLGFAGGGGFAGRLEAKAAAQQVQ